MDRRKIEQLEKAIKQKTGRQDQPPPGFFRTGDVLIDNYREELLKLGYTLEQVNNCPIFIEP